LEDNFEEDAIVLVGIADRGYIFAQRLQQILQEIAPTKTFDLIKITIEKTKRSLEAKTDVSIETAKDKVIILIDDVLNSGRPTDDASQTMTANLPSENDKNLN